MKIPVRTTRAATPHRDHVVRFYDRDEFLCRTVAQYVREGIDRHEAVLVIATPEHRRGFQGALEAEGVDLAAARESGQLTEVDAEELLSRFLVGGLPRGAPDPEAFRSVVGGLIQDLSRRNGFADTRAYGEMVDLLLKHQNSTAALRLEEMWNALGLEMPFQLYCAYGLANFDHPKQRKSFRAICDLHAHILPAEEYVDTSLEAQRRIAQLEQSARALVLEIRERKRVERNLRRRERELTDFIENAAVGLHWIGPDGAILWANHAELELLGYSKGEYLGHHIREFHADPAVSDDILARLAKGEKLRDHEAPLKAKDGSIRHVMINSTVYRENGRFIHTRCFTRDITEQKKLNQALSEERERLREANRRKDEFLAMLSHELRNPLAPILSALDLMDMTGDEATRQERAIIRRQATHLAGLVEDLLDISRVVGGKITLRKEALELSVIVARGIELAKPLIEQGAHELHLEVPERGLLLEADPVRLPQVVANLLTNAAKYTRMGGDIWVCGRREGNQVIVEVSDNGIGIAPEMLATMFEPFVQAGRTIDRSQGGLGLGLTLVRSFTQLHGGSVSAQSDGPGKGSRFFVRLPALDSTRTPEGDSRTGAPGIGAARPVTSQRVLVVEDNADCATVFAEVIRRLGHRVEVAYNGSQALAIARAFKPTAALVDIGLPFMDGYELARRLRQSADGHPLMIIAVTGYGEEADRAKSKDAGIDLHTIKPVDLEYLKRVLAQAGADSGTNGGKSHPLP